MSVAVKITRTDHTAAGLRGLAAKSKEAAQVRRLLALALILASIKVTIVLTYFMHLKFENLLLRIMVGAVFLLFAIGIAITFIDYYFR